SRSASRSSRGASRTSVPVSLVFRGVVRLALAALALAAVAGTASATPPESRAHPCRAALPHGPSLPAPVIMWDDCGVFRLEGDGRGVRLRRHWLAFHGSGPGRRFGADIHLLRTHSGAYVL